MNRGSVDAQDLRCLANRHNLPSGRLRRQFVAWNVAIATQAANMIRREAFTARSFASLTIENAGDDIIRVMNGQTTKQRDRIFVGVKTTRLHARQGEIEFGERAASPAQSQMRKAFGAIHSHNHFFQKGAQKLFAIAIRGGRRRPDFSQIGAERENLLFLFLAQHARALLFPPLEFRFGSGEIAQAFFPFRFQSTCHESVFGLNGTILTLGSFGFVASTFHRQTPLSERRIVVRFELLDGAAALLPEPRASEP